MARKNKTPRAAAEELDLLAVEINGRLIRPGLDLNSQEWTAYRLDLGFKRLGLMEKKRLGGLWRETMYLLDDPGLAALKGGFRFKPRLHSFEEPPAAHLAESLWRTRAIVAFYGEKLFRWGVETAGDSGAAELFFKRAETKAEKLLGEARDQGGGKVWTTPSAEVRLTAVSDQALLLVTFRPDTL